MKADRPEKQRIELNGMRCEDVEVMVVVMSQVSSSVEVIYLLRH